jgi:capsular exopolysaccharide synthesis family protein
MSQIFDALQKSENEDAKTDPSNASEATELLQRAERRAVGRWESATLPNQSEVSASTVVAGSSELPAEEEHDLLSGVPRVKVSPTPQNRLVCLTDSDGPAAEAFRLLGVRLRHLRRDKALKTVLITSTIPQEGKSMVAVNLACTLALKPEHKVLLIEGDLRRPSLSQMFGMEANAGLSECLQSNRAVGKSLYYLEGLNLWILPAGGASSNALDLLQSGRLPALIQQLSAWFDWMIIDAPPVLPLADTSVWSRMADGILLVTRQGVTKKQQLLRGIEALESKKLVGALLNWSRHADHDEYDYYYRSTPNLPKASDGSAG